MHVASLRKKLGDPGWIETVRGVGFRLRGPDMTRRLLLSYLSITCLRAAVLEIPLGILVRAEASGWSAAVERDALALATVVEDTSSEAGATSRAGPVAGRATRTHRRPGGGGRPAGLTVADSDPPAPGRRDFATPAGDRRRAARPARRRLRVPRPPSAATFLYVAVPVASERPVHGAVRITYPTSTVDARVRRGTGCSWPGSAAWSWPWWPSSASPWPAR